MDAGELMVGGENQKKWGTGAAGVGGGGQSKGGGDEGGNDARGGSSKETSVMLLE